MIIQEIKNQHLWQDFFNKNGSPSFLQSWPWGEFQKKQGYQILRLGLYQQEKLQAIALVLKMASKRGRFLFIPHGPIFSLTVKNNLKLVKLSVKYLLDYLIALSKKENFSFIRLAPVLENTHDYQQIFQDLSFKTAPIYMHAERVWVLAINKTEDELLKQMRKTTRYLIRKANRDGVVIEKRTDEKAVDDFYEIYKKTSKREHFTPFSKEFIKNEFEAFHKTGDALFLFAKLTNNKPILTKIDNFNYLASALIIFTSSTAFYHQGASIHTKIPAAYLLQWQAIKEAKKRGCLFYNFWGIYQENRTPKSWQGLTLFKTGFGGEKIDYLSTYDYIISPKYYLTYFYEKFLNLKRGV